MNPFKIILADVSQESRKELTEFLESHYYCSVIGQANNTESFLQLGELIPQADVLLLDIHLFKFSGCQLSQRISIQYPNTKVIIMVRPEDYKYLVNLMGINLKEIVYKTSLFSDIIPALERVLEGKTMLSSLNIATNNQMNLNTSF